MFLFLKQINPLNSPDSLIYNMFLDGPDYQIRQPVWMDIRDGKVNAILPPSEEARSLPVIAPCMVDLQDNCYGGINFNTFSF